MSRVRLILGLTALLTAAACIAGEPVDVVKVIDGDTIRVETADGPLTIRFLGVDTPERGRKDRVAEFLAEEAHEFTRGLTDGRRVTLEIDPEADTIDRYGRALRYVYLPDGRMLNALLLSEGYAQAYTRFPFSRIEEFRQLEVEARKAGRGLWDPGALPQIRAEEAAEFVGRTAKVCDRVASTHHARNSKGAPTFLNLGRPHPDQPLTVVIWGNDRKAFGEPEKRYANLRICVTGKVRTFRGRPEITAADPSQITTDAAPGS